MPHPPPVRSLRSPLVRRHASLHFTAACSGCRPPHLSPFSAQNSTGSSSIVYSRIGEVPAAVRSRAPSSERPCFRRQPSPVRPQTVAPNASFPVLSSPSPCPPCSTSSPPDHAPRLRPVSSPHRRYLPSSAVSASAPRNRSPRRGATVESSSVAQRHHITGRGPAPCHSCLPRPTEGLPASWAGVAVGHVWHCASRLRWRSTSKPRECCATGPQADLAYWHLIYFSIL
jgi:hypothetical protein